MRFAWFQLVFLGATLLVSASAAGPNIVLILADDLGYGDVGCYGGSLSETPHIDALAAKGLRFTDFHSSGTMCSPTRAATLTGQYQQRFGRKFDSALGARNHDEGLPLEPLTIAEHLKANGYATACFGKWHLGYGLPSLPLNYGFDEFRGLVSGDGDYHTHVNRSGGEDWWKQNELAKESGYTTELLTKYSLDFIERHHEEPFFLYLPHLAIHFPWQGPEDPPHRQVGTDYAQDKWGIVPDRSNVTPHIKAMVEALDQSVGQILAALQKWDLEENTLVVFTSDNGGYLTYGKDFRNISSNGIFRGQKTEMYEGGHRVPMIISWPGKIQPGVSDELAHSTDLYPTLARIAGAPTDSPDLDGFDISAHLFERAAIPQRQLFWRMGETFAVRSGPWKLCRPKGKKEPELYNLEEDPSETKDLAKSKPDLVQELRKAWDEWEADVNQTAQKYES